MPTCVCLIVCTITTGRIKNNTHAVYVYFCCTQSLIFYLSKWIYILNRMSVHLNQFFFFSKVWTTWFLERNNNVPSCPEHLVISRIGAPYKSACVCVLALASVGYYWQYSLYVCVCVRVLALASLVIVCCLLLYELLTSNCKPPRPRLVVLTITCVCVLALASVGYYWQYSICVCVSWHGPRMGWQ